MHIHSGSFYYFSVFCFRHYFNKILPRIIILFPVTSHQTHHSKSHHMMTLPPLSFRPQDSLHHHVEMKSNPDAPILKYLNFVSIMLVKKARKSICHNYVKSVANPNPADLAICLHIWQHWFLRIHSLIEYVHIICTDHPYSDKLFLLLAINFPQNTAPLKICCPQKFYPLTHCPLGPYVNTASRKC
jgi:hypothetical protein